MFVRVRGMGRCVLITSLVAGCGTLRKPPEPDRRLEIHTLGDLFESSTGYRFAALPEPSAQFVRVVVRYPVGSSDDPPGKPGLAHLVEHLLFDVQLDHGGAKSSIVGELGRVALSWNGETTADYTDYETTAVPSALGDLLELEADRTKVGCAGLTEEISSTSARWWSTSSASAKARRAPRSSARSTRRFTRPNIPIARSTRSSRSRRSRSPMHVRFSRDRTGAGRHR